MAGVMYAHNLLRMISPLEKDLDRFRKDANKLTKGHNHYFRRILRLLDALRTNFAKANISWDDTFKVLKERWDKFDMKEGSDIFDKLSDIAGRDRRAFHIGYELAKAIHSDSGSEEFLKTRNPDLYARLQGVIFEIIVIIREEGKLLRIERERMAERRRKMMEDEARELKEIRLHRSDHSDVREKLKREHGDDLTRLMDTYYHWLEKNKKKTASELKKDESADTIYAGSTRKVA